MMSEGQNERVTKKQLTPEVLDDDALNRAEWVAKLDRVVVSPDKAVAIVGDYHCLVHDSEHRRWYHYQPRIRVTSWAFAQDSAQLWGLVLGKKLAMLDLRSGEWIEFGHHINYKSILHAEGDVVVAQCGGVLAIDLLRLENNSLRRIMRIPVTPEFALETMASAFWLDKNQFVIEEDHGYHIILRNLDWDGQTKSILKINGRDALLCFPLL